MDPPHRVSLLSQLGQPAVEGVKLLFHPLRHRELVVHLGQGGRRRAVGVPEVLHGLQAEGGDGQDHEEEGDEGKELKKKNVGKRNRDILFRLLFLPDSSLLGVKKPIQCSPDRRP